MAKTEATQTTNELVTGKKPPVRKRVAARARNHTVGFVDFIRTQGIVGLAIGFIIGTQAKVLVDQMSNSFVNPILGLIVGGDGGLSAQTFTVTVGDRTAVFAWGEFAFVLINFLILAAIVYFTFKMLRLDKLDKKKG